MPLIPDAVYVAACIVITCPVPVVDVYVELPPNLLLPLPTMNAYGVVMVWFVPAVGGPLIYMVDTSAVVVTGDDAVMVGAP